MEGRRCRVEGRRWTVEGQMPIAAARRRMTSRCTAAVATRCHGGMIDTRHHVRPKPEAGSRKPEAPLSEHRGGVEGERPKVDGDR